ncbi:type II toxin-antitoxin system RelE/ParE family toxin [Sphingomonas sp. RIT328]|uniref:type II toxin-antitoxin system RelE/ParE family toxin n=1 Tax=Sphingomonas sp. RIT328 TaxID=1470591 RepID=UPI00044773C5|nr:type II toxin-antitoxin system RelE/ParE family toxin [Sphingomonas sp. RIT328]EZP49159.1 Plasmid stabilization system protein [Sphingomonas sp. RIT328]
MRRAIWARRALDDLAGIDDFYAQDDPAHADHVGRAAVRAARFLAEHPYAGPRMEDDKRKWRVPGTYYLLLYRVAPAGVEILRVHHGRENWMIS